MPRATIRDGSTKISIGHSAREEQEAGHRDQGALVKTSAERTEDYQRKHDGLSSMRNKAAARSGSLPKLSKVGYNAVFKLRGPDPEAVLDDLGLPLPDSDPIRGSAFESGRRIG